MNLKAEVPSQRTSPRIIHDHDRAKWGSLHDSLDLPAVPHSTPNSLDEQKLNGAFIIVVATFPKGVAIEEGSQPVLRSPAFEEILPDRFGNQNSREEKAELRQEIKMVERDYARAVDRTAAFPHSGQLRSAGARRSNPSASVPKANNAFLAVCWPSISLRRWTMPISARSGLRGSNTTSLELK